MPRTNPADISAAVLDRFDNCQDRRLQTIMRALVAHLHAFVTDVELTDEEWREAISLLTATGDITDARRQEWILWSDALGVSMLVDSLGNRYPGGATESTVLGPFFVPGSPKRAYGDRLDEIPAGEPAWIHGRVLSLDGTPLADAELDVWQNGDSQLYGVQDPDAPEAHLRGRFTTREDGTYAFLAVRPTPYPIPHDGPVGRMLQATGRHPYRPAHVHMIVRAAGHKSVTTHLFDRTSPYIESDAVFAVKPSLLREFVRHEADEPDTPAGVAGRWWSLESDFVLAPADKPGEPIDPGRTG